MNDIVPSMVISRPVRAWASLPMFDRGGRGRFGTRLFALPLLAAMSSAATSLAATPAGLTAQDPISLLPPMEWRSIGPDRGGRSIAVAGHAEHPG